MRVILVLYFAGMFLPGMCLAQPDPDVDAAYQKISQEYNDLLKTLPTSVKQRLKAHSTKHQTRFSSRQQEQLDSLQVLDAKYQQIRLVYELKEALNKTYLEKHPDKTIADINPESSRIAQAVIPEIERLAKSYHLVGSPIIHNILVNAGMRNRGRCKDWAEDLLTFLKKVPRQHFQIMWGEANAEKINEHNVAVLVPEDGTFDDGIMIDPWRTKGNPFWLRVSKDKHYHWNQWLPFGVY